VVFRRIYEATRVVELGGLLERRGYRSGRGCWFSDGVVYLVLNLAVCFIGEDGIEERLDTVEVEVSGGNRGNKP